MRGSSSSTRGFTLIELLVSAALGVLVMVLVGGMLVSTLNAQSSVRAAAQSSNTGQLVAKALTRDVRGARDLTTAIPFAGTCLLRLTVVDNALTAPVSVHFVAWYFGNGEIRTRRSNIAIADPVSPAAVTTAWTLLATGVQRSGSTPVFTASGSQVGLTFTVAGSTGAPVLIQTTDTSRQPMPTAGPGSSTSCS
ncbi:prepilin-type N-terminal cleavage/methylation domain-containing protein [Cryobacterium sp. M23]|uniref:PulJ/GspJ family protein n=1 Tax=Cryobacterium sp. M23 TaxID=2048292 RepID=UPI000CE550D9